jgi:hypothetical protein
VVDEDNQVMCLTCHKAHGSKYDNMLVWPYARYSGTGVPTSYRPIDSNTACQQCHNRGVHG